MTNDVKGTELQANDFIEVVTGYDCNPDSASNWSKIVSASVKRQNFDEVPYQTTQMLEPSVIWEVARLSGIAADDLRNFRYPRQGPAAKVAWLYDNVQHATSVQRVNLATALASTARYREAAAVLADVDVDALFPEQRVALHLIRFVVANRMNAPDAADALEQLRPLAQHGELAQARVLDIASQAIVWSIKPGGVPNGLAEFYRHEAFRVAQKLERSEEFRAQISLSCFYRAYAMVPAQRGDARETRDIMVKARRYAEAAEPHNELDAMVRLDAIKTVEESTLKEHLYLGGDTTAAERAGKALVDLDPRWPISYHELAEVYLATGNHAAAADSYSRAAALGAPRLPFSLFMKAQCAIELGSLEEGLADLDQVLAIDPANVSASVVAYRAAKKGGHARVAEYEHRVKTFNEQGLLKPEHRQAIGWET